VYVIILKKKTGPPRHLLKWQEKMKRVAPICAEKTKDLKGTKRVKAFNQCIATLMKEDKNGQEQEK